MHLIALVEGVEHVCCRYRLRAFQSGWRRAGHDVTLQPIPQDPFSWLRLRKTLARAEGVILQRRLLQGWQLGLVRLATPLLFYDFDDAVFLRDSYSTKGPLSRQRLLRFTRIVNQADVVLAGNRFLADQTRRLAPGAAIAIVPTCVEPTGQPRSLHLAKGNGVQLVWIGSSSTLKGLERVAPLLEEIGTAVPEVSLKLICDRFLTFEHLPVVPCFWSEQTERYSLATSDIGISWLPDDDWSRGKCGLKVLQYMAAGLPVVANPVGVQKEMVRHGETGFLVETPAEWIEAIRRLSNDPALRRKMGGLGRQMVEERYSVAAGTGIWCDLLEGLTQRRSVA